MGAGLRGGFIVVCLTFLCGFGFGVGGCVGGEKPTM